VDINPGCTGDILRRSVPANLLRGVTRNATVTIAATSPKETSGHLALPAPPHCPSIKIFPGGHHAAGGKSHGNRTPMIASIPMRALEHHGGLM